MNLESRPAPYIVDFDAKNGLLGLEITYVLRPHLIYSISFSLFSKIRGNNESIPKELVLRLSKIAMRGCCSDDVFFKVLEVLHISVDHVNSVLQDICVGTLERV